MSSLPHADLSGVPVGPPPPGISSNFLNPPTLAPITVTVSILLLVWTLLFVVIRLHANFRAPRGLGIDDYFCIIATISAVTYMGLVFSLNRVARHNFDVPWLWIDAKYLKISYAENLMVGPTLFFGKSTILLLYLRIFTANKKMRYSVWSGLAWCFGLYWSYVPISAVYCSPRIGQTWSIYTVTNCPKLLLPALIQSALSIPLDLYIFILPIPIVLRLQMSLKRRMSILGIFGTAFLGIAAAVLRLTYQVKLYRSSDDELWLSAIAFICIICESYVAIIVSSMPAFASIFKNKLPRVSWPSSLKSLVLKSKTGASSSKIRLGRRSGTEITSSGKSMIPGGHVHDQGYLELRDTRPLGGHEITSVKTEIQGEGATPKYLQEGLTPKSIAVHQSMRQERSAA